MKHRQIVLIAFVMVIVFGGIVTLYPRMFSSEPTPAISPENPVSPVAPGPMPVVTPH